MNDLPETAEEIIECLNAIRILHDITENKIRAFVALDPGPDYYADICDDYHFMFRTAMFVRQSELLDELHEVPKLIVYPYDHTPLSYH